jgi:hypothetical protein
VPVLALATTATQSFAPLARAQGGLSVRIASPANGATATNPVTVTVTTSGAVIKDAAANDPNAAHLHYFIDRDPATVLRPGQPIPSGQADIIHTPNTSQVLPNLSPGTHSVWVVLAHTDHTPYSPNVQDQVTFTIGGANSPPSGGDAATAAPSLPPGGTGGVLPHAGAANHALAADSYARSWLTMGAAGLAALLGLALLRRSKARSQSD